MRILITNADGVYSPGILALSQEAAKFGEVRIVAPDVERSSAGQSITASRPLTYKRTPIKDFEAFRVNGTPSDCVALGAHNWEKVDVVLSGINLGSNLGNSMWHSGTLAGAKQATLLGLRGIALSTPVGDEDPAFDALKPWVAEVLGHLLSAEELRLVNVNFPAQTPRGLRWTSQSVRHYDGKVVPAHFIQTLTVKVNGKTVVEGEISQAVSRNPVFSFRVKGGAKGDKVEVSWVDTEGETNKTEAAVA